MVLKFFKYTFYSIGGSLLFITFVLLFTKVNPIQKLDLKKEVAPRLLDSTYHAKHINDLWEKWSKNKELPKGYELPTLLALSHFPELKDVHVKIRYLPTTIPLSSRPYFWSMIRSRKKWIFHILISSKSTAKFEPILLKNLPFNAQVGILAHELSHTLYYQNMSFRQLIKFGLQYTFDSDFRRKHERSTDEQTILYGLGWQLYDYAYFIRHNLTIPSPYIKAGHDTYMDKYYLSSEEVLKKMESLGTYKIHDDKLKNLINNFPEKGNLEVKTSTPTIFSLFTHE